MKLPVWAVVFSTALLCTASEAQIGPMRESPGETRPPLPDFEPTDRERGTLLPRIEIPKEPDTEGLSAGVEIFIRTIRVTGYTVLSDDEVDMIEVTSMFRNRTLIIEVPDCEVWRIANGTVLGIAAGDDAGVAFLLPAFFAVFGAFAFLTGLGSEVAELAGFGSLTTGLAIAASVASGFTGPVEALSACLA